MHILYASETYIHTPAHAVLRIERLADFTINHALKCHGRGSATRFGEDMSL